MAGYRSLDNQKLVFVIIKHDDKIGTNFDLVRFLASVHSANLSCNYSNKMLAYSCDLPQGLSRALNRLRGVKSHVSGRVRVFCPKCTIINPMPITLGLVCTGCDWEFGKIQQWYSYLYFDR